MPPAVTGSAVGVGLDQHSEPWDAGVVCSMRLWKLFLSHWACPENSSLLLASVLSDRRPRTKAATSPPAITQSGQRKKTQGNGPGLSPKDHRKSELAVTESANVLKL